MRAGVAAEENCRLSALEVERAREEEDELDLERLSRSLSDFADLLGVPMPKDAGTCEAKECERGMAALSVLLSRSESCFEACCRPFALCGVPKVSGVRCMLQNAKSRMPDQSAQSVDVSACA